MEKGIKRARHAACVAVSGGENRDLAGACFFFGSHHTLHRQMLTLVAAPPLSSLARIRVY